MKKRFWTRLIAAVLTMAMAFSILAVPASAATTETEMDKRKIVGTVSYGDNDEWTLWVTEEFMKLNGGIIEDKDVTPIEGKEVPNYIFFGLSFCSQEEVDEDTEVLWYIETVWWKIYHANDNANRVEIDANGVVSITYQYEDETLYPISENLDLNSNWAVIDEEERTISTKELMLDNYRAQVDNDEEAEYIAAEYYLWNLTRGAAYKGAIPEGVYAGLISENKIFWYSKEQVELIREYLENVTELEYIKFLDSIDLEKGAIKIADDVIVPIVITDLNGVPISDSEASSGVSSGGGSAGAIVAAAGAAAVAATGVYFYTHPEKWQETKDYVAELSANVQAKFQEFTDGVKGALGIPTEEETAETAESAENAAAPQDAAA